jgi:hypothetical protein
MKHLTLALLATLILSQTALATSRTYYIRKDRQIESAARLVLADLGSAGLSVDSNRGRLILRGELPSGTDWENLSRRLIEATGAISVHPERE